MCHKNVAMSKKLSFFLDTLVLLVQFAALIFKTFMLLWYKIIRL